MMFAGADALQRSQSASLVESSIETIRGNEQAFLESLESLIISTGTSQQHCIAQLRSLGLPDDFWMYVFKVVPCSKTYSHKWTLCPCAHAGETARRRDPRVVNYKAVLCPIVKGKKTCPLGDSCSYAHNVFEHWLHPSRYKTRLCSFGRNCNRPICFFAHSADELRCVPNADDGKEIDEREYMLQVMMAQQENNGNLLAARTLGSISQPATPMNGLSPVSAFCPPSASTPNTPFGAFLDLPQAGQAGSHPPPRHQHSMPPLSPTTAMASLLSASPIRVKPNNVGPNLSQLSMAHSLPVGDAATAVQLMQLQEALAALNMGGLDGLSGMGSAATPHSANAAAANRTSDPGFNTADAAAKVLSSMQLNRTISDSGQALPNLVGSSNLPAGLESLLPFMGGLPPAAQQQQQLGGSATGMAAPGLGGMGMAPPTPTAGPPPQPVSSAAPSSSSPIMVPAGTQPKLGSPPVSPTADRSGSPAGSSSSTDTRQVLIQRQMSDTLPMLGPSGGSMTASRLMRTVSGGAALMGNASTPPPALSSTSSITANNSGSSNAIAGSVGSSGGSSNAQLQQEALQTLAAAAAASGTAAGGTISATTVNKIVSELQEQGLAGSKDQLVASLSQLLAQLLSANN